MPVTSFTGTQAVDGSLKPNAVTGHWGWGPITLEYTFTFASVFFDADIKILGAKVLTITLDADGSENASAEAFGWAIDVTITYNSADKEIVAVITATDNGTLKFDHTFVLFTWK